MAVFWGGLLASFVAAVVALLTKKWERRQQSELLRSDLQQRNDSLQLELKQRNDSLQRELEHRTRAILRKSYVDVLVTQRRSREASLRLAAADEPSHKELLKEATAAHDDFIAAYHQLNLDSSRNMWLEARALRDVLDDMLKFAQERPADKCIALIDIARHARQNLEGRFRELLGYETLQPRKNLGEYDKVERPASD